MHMSQSIARATPSARQLAVEYRPASALKPDPRNARTHPKRQIEQIVASIRRVRLYQPDPGRRRRNAHRRVMAASGRKAARVGRGAGHHARWSRPMRRSGRLRLADNKIALNAGWDLEILQARAWRAWHVRYRLRPRRLTGFSTGEIDVILKAANDPDDEVIPPVPASPAPGLATSGFLASTGSAAATAATSTFFERVVGEGASIDAAFLDPPYNVRINGHANATGRHREFAMASGEMSEAEFRAFLTETLGAAARVSRDGAVHFVCMDWRHMDDVSARRPCGLWRSPEPLRLEQVQCRHGLALPLQARAGLCLPGRERPAFQHGRARQARPQPHQRLGLRLGQLDGRAAGARIWRCIRPSSRPRWSPTPSRT